MQDAADFFRARFAQHLQQLAVGLAAVDQDRFAQLYGEAQLCAQDRLLLLRGRGVEQSVESDFADGDAPGMFKRCRELFDGTLVPFGRRLRMDAGGRVDARVTVRQIDQPRPAELRDAGDQPGADAGVLCFAQGLCGRGEGVQMHVRVEPCRAVAVHDWNLAQPRRVRKALCRACPMLAAMPQVW